MARQKGQAVEEKPNGASTHGTMFAFVCGAVIFLYFVNAELAAIVLVPLILIALAYVCGLHKLKISTGGMELNWK